MKIDLDPQKVNLTITYWIAGVIWAVTVFCIIFCVSTYAQADGNQTIKNFRQAKKQMLRIWRENSKTFYCQCQYKGKKVDFTSCGYVPVKNNKRSKRIEAEHIVPASRFGRKFLEWQKGSPACGKKRGRRCLKKVSVKFRMMEADLFNLVPAIGSINLARSNYRFGIIQGELRRFGACDFETENRIAEPRPDIRGDIARVYFYMSQAYPGYINLTKTERQQFLIWSSIDPPDAWEKRRIDLIEQIQGNKFKR